MRDTRNVYATFVSIMDANAISMKKKHVFEQAPIEKSLVDYYSQMQNAAFMIAGTSLHELDLKLQNKSNEIML